VKATKWGLFDEESQQEQSTKLGLLCMTFCQIHAKS